VAGWLAEWVGGWLMKFMKVINFFKTNIVKTARLKDKVTNAQ